MISSMSHHLVPPCHAHRAMEDGAPAALGPTAVALDGFVANYAAFLADFAAACQARLHALATKVERAEAMMQQLEAKLASQDLREGQREVGGGRAGAAEAVQNNVLNGRPLVDAGLVGVAARTAPPEVTLKSTAGLEKFQRLLEMGMPIEHVRLKMQSQGLDTTSLDAGNPR